MILRGFKFSDHAKMIVMGEILSYFYRHRDLDKNGIITDALKLVENEPYYKCLWLSYGRHWSAWHIGRELFCDRATVNRNRKKLCAKMFDYLWGDSDDEL